MKTFHFGHGKRADHGIDLEWAVLAIMVGIGLALAIKLLWFLGIGLGAR